MPDELQPDVTALTVQLLSAYVSKNNVPSESLADLIRSTRAALLQNPAEEAGAAEPEYVPAVSIRKSLSSPDHILSLINGQPYKTLKRHLEANGLTADEYRQRYKLPKSYPLVAPNYSEARRGVAQRLGLGRKTPAGNAETTPAQSAPPEQPKAAAKPATAAPVKAPAASPNKDVKSKAAEKPTADAKAKARKRLSIASPKGQDKAAAAADAPTPPKAKAKRRAAPRKTASAETKGE